MVKPQLVVLAAGIGSRYGGLKQIDPIGPGGELLLDYTIHDALAAGFERVVFVIREEIRDAFRDRFETRLEPWAEGAFAVQSVDGLPDGRQAPADRKRPWGTAHAVLSAAPFLDAPFAVVNADDFYGRETFRLLHDHLTGLRDGSIPHNRFGLVGFTLKNTLSDHGHVSRGVCRIDDGGRLNEIVERKKIRRANGRIEYREADTNEWVEIAPDRPVSMNSWAFSHLFLEEARRGFREFLDKHLHTDGAEFMIPPLVNRLIDEDRAEVKVDRTDADWFGMTYREDKEQARGEIRRRIEDGTYPERLWDAASGSETISS